MSLPVFLLVVFLSAVLLTGFVRIVAIRAKILDLPTSRSAHVSPTPVGGGVSIALVTLISICIFFYNGNIPANEFLALCSAGLVAGVGLFDDIKNLYPLASSCSIISCYLVCLVARKHTLY